MKMEIGGIRLHRASGAFFRLRCVVMEVGSNGPRSRFFHDQFNVRQVAVLWARRTRSVRWRNCCFIFQTENEPISRTDAKGGSLIALVIHITKSRAPGIIADTAVSEFNF